MTNPDKKEPVALIAGPTASGKTALALELAKRTPCVIINADSAQVYADLPILSAQPTAAEMDSAPHRLFGYIDGEDPCSAVRWAQDARAAIADAHAAARLPVLVGGTGLYIRTLIEGIAPMPPIGDAVRARVRALSTAQAWEALLSEDPDFASTLYPNDDSRIKRALEVIRSTGRSIADWRRHKTGGIGSEIDLRPLILLPPREWLYDRCDRRFVEMIAGGAVDEVKTVMARGLPNDSPVMRAIGVPQISAMLRGDITRNEAVTLGQIATRQYAKRQFTWFRNQTPSHWLRVESNNENDIKADIEILLQY